MNTNHVAFVWRFIAKLFKTKTDLILFFMFIYFFFVFFGMMASLSAEQNKRNIFKEVIKEYRVQFRKTFPYRKSVIYDCRPTESIA